MEKSLWADLCILNKYIVIEIYILCNNKFTIGLQLELRYRINIVYFCIIIRQTMNTKSTPYTYISKVTSTNCA